ncbi:indole-3-glycerol phosphate synthase [Legionella sainthelensi]|uniref:indole-3-glycerol phosphate synthase TrpC n=1 Tax=Legionella sainthelensi TaxID=28087 RepID=UPI000E1FE62C|nr:indole-3-glycerol phosphate synthase TrpC [Legionella sainthelensi]VEB36544.1 indole-3-glycerol phosphate synthase [Legionella sainthelensi]
MNSVLERITQKKLEEICLAKKNKPLDLLKQQPMMEQRSFLNALQNQETPAIIAEIKRASPSKGIIREDFNVAEIATIYGLHGARCLSVLTDIDFFQGHPDYIAQAKMNSNLPVLRKDFILDTYQIYESLALGADCILLIVALLDDVQLIEFCQLAQELGMAVLVESHTQEELERALRLPTPLIGVNNRSLHTFHTNIQLSIDLKHYISNDRITITESGINNHADIRLMQSHGINTFLVGESLMRAKDIGNALDQLIKGD